MYDHYFMRRARIIGQGVQFYHCMSRILERRFFIQHTEKAFFLSTLRRLEQFSGVKVLTYCLMDNHFHLLLKVGKRPKTLSEKELLRRIEILYGQEKASLVKETFNKARKSGSKTWLEQEKQIYLDRTYDLSIFMKELKQRFTQWYNRRNDRRGPLWEDRFKSVLVEGTHQALLTMASYIDLNPVRAGICQDPKDYRWCGYGEALGGGVAAKTGLQELTSFLLPSKKWDVVQKKYRTLLFGIGRETSERKGIDREKVQEVIASGGALSRFELLRCRVRYFNDGLALGSREFIESVFEQYREHFGEKREAGSRPMRGTDQEDLFTIRDLRKEVISVPP